MRIIRIAMNRMRALLRRPRAEADLQREIEIHVEQLTKQYLSEGMEESEARMAARREFGSVKLTKEQCRDMRRVNLVEDFGKDAMLALRLMRKSPGFTLTAVQVSEIVEEVRAMASCEASVDFILMLPV